jgi:hypothetical protein
MAPIATLVYVILKGDRENVQRWKDYQSMKKNVDFKNNEEKKEKAKRFFGL